MSHFILMLTHNDRTVSNALAVYEDLRDTDLAYVGFKDIGVSYEELRVLAARIHADGRRVMLEVVSTRREDELRSIRAAMEMGVDYVLGGRQADQALPLLSGGSIGYFPFCGNTVGHPTVLEGTIDEIVADARRLASMSGVHGLDLLSYRFAGDAEELTRRVVRSVDTPIIAAGSIDRPERIRAMCEAGVWGFTIGSALFEGKFVTHLLRQQIRSVVQMEGVSA